MNATQRTIEEINKIAIEGLNQNYCEKAYRLLYYDFKKNYFDELVTYEFHESYKIQLFANACKAVIILKMEKESFLLLNSFVYVLRLIHKITQPISVYELLTEEKNTLNELSPLKEDFQMLLDENVSVKDIEQYDLYGNGKEYSERYAGFLSFCLQQNEDLLTYLGVSFGSMEQLYPSPKTRFICSLQDFVGAWFPILIIRMFLDGNDKPNIGLAILILLLALTWFIMYYIGESKAGKTFSRKRYQLILIKSSFLPPSPSQSIFRSVLKYISIFLLPISLLFLLFKPQRALHDYLVGTYMLKDNYPKNN